MAPADPAAVARLEARLPPCKRCGKGFRYANSFRCPGCGAPYIDFQRHPEQRQGEYYGNHLYGDEVQALGGP
jgi:tRNA(Ile2) C34 agmatinyltransferase TiaS